MSKLVRYVVFFILLYTLTFSNNTALANSLSTHFSAPSVTVSSESNGTTCFKGDEIQVPGIAGEPQIPYQVLKVLLPPETDLSSVSVSLENIAESRMAGFWDVSPISPMATWDGEKTIVVWPEGRNIKDGRDVDIYETDAFFPQKRMLPRRTGEIRGWKVIDIPVALFRYNPITRRLMRLKYADIVVNYSAPTGKSSVNGTSGSIAPDMVRDSVINFDDMSPAYTGQTGSDRRSGEAVLPGYVIITTEAIAEASSSLDQFVSHKQLQGFDVSVVTEEDWGGNTGDKAADNLRSWLAENYLGLNAKYVLLVGNPDPASGDVPMKMLWPRNNAVFYEEYKESPSDLYYADLTGNWDLDGDGYYGEWGDDFENGGIDTNWDVVVGRIPVYDSIADLDSILTKTIRYETADPSTTEWRKKVLLPMVPSDISTPGYYLGEAIKDDVLSPLRDRSYFRIYSEDYGLNPAPEITPCSTENVTITWADESFGSVFWWTHGSRTTAWKIMDTDHVTSLDDSHPSIVFQCSCLNAYPEEKDNLSYALLKNGAIVAIGATRVSWYTRAQTEYFQSGTNSGMTYSFSRKLLLNGMNTGMALSSIKQNTYLSDAQAWMNFTDFNIYGDPTLELDIPNTSLRTITVNIDGPSEARWLLGRKEDHKSSDTVNIVSGTECDISFTDVDGWIKPYSSTVTVPSDDNIVLNVSYNRKTLSGPTFVKPDGNGDGSSWDSPINLADALRNAMSGEELWIAEGLYLPIYDTMNNLPLEGRDHEATFTLKSDIKLYGGFPSDLTGNISADRDPSRHRTVLTGDLDGDDAVDEYGVVINTADQSGSNVFHVLYCSGIANVLLDGLNITAGQALDSESPYGGGLYVTNSVLRVNQCKLSGNASCRGGAIASKSSEIFLYHDNFTGNASSGGGGVFSLYSSIYADDCMFRDNRAEDSGGALESYHSDIKISNCSYLKNEAKKYGGGISISGGSAYTTDSVFEKNISLYVGGAVNSYVADPVFYNCTFFSNKSVCNGAAIYSSDGTAKIDSSTFSSNISTEGVSTLYAFFGSMQVTRSILWDNTAKEIKFAEASEPIAINHCVVRSGLNDTVSADHIISEDPCLGTLADNGGSTMTCALLPGSSAIDSINSEGVTSCDQRGVTRPQGAGVDIGAYEVQPGSVRVFLHGPDGVTWSLDGDGNHHDGDTVQNLQIGDYSISFASASGWKTPAEKTVTVTEAETLLVAGDYGLNTTCPASWSHVEAGDSVTLAWEPFSVFQGSENYEVYIMNENGNFVQVPDEQVDGNSVTMDLNGHTTYTLRVDANGFEGTPWTFTTPNRAPLLVRRSPVNSSNRLPVDTSLSWLYEDPDGDSVDYFVYMCDVSPDKKSLSLITSGDATSFAPELSSDHRYDWQVEARDRFRGMESFEQGIASGDIWSFAVTGDIHRITSPVSDEVLVPSGINDIWVATLSSADLDALELDLGEGIVPASKILSMDVEALSSDTSSEDRQALLKETGTLIMAVLPEGFNLAVSVSNDVNFVPVPITLSFTEKQIGQILNESTLLDDVHIFVLIDDRVFDIVTMAGDEREELFSITYDEDESGITYFVSFQLYLSSQNVSDRGMSISSTTSASGISLLTETEDPAFLIEGISRDGDTFRASVMEATVGTAETGSGGGCIAGPLAPAFLMLLLPLWALKKK